MDRMSRKKAFSFTKGCSFSFEEDDRQVEAWFSVVSGLEKVYVDGELVSSQRNFSKNSTNSFKLGENEYSITLEAVSLFKGPFVCTLSKNGKAYKRQKLIYPKAIKTGKKSHFVLRLIFFVGVGVAFGLLKADLQLPEASIYIFVAVLFITEFVYQLKTAKRTPLIEDEKIV